MQLQTGRRAEELAYQRDRRREKQAAARGWLNLVARTLGLVTAAALLLLGLIGETQLTDFTRLIR